MKSKCRCTVGSFIQELKIQERCLDGRPISERHSICMETKTLRKCREKKQKSGFKDKAWKNSIPEMV